MSSDIVVVDSLVDFKTMTRDKTILVSLRFKTRDKRVAKSKKNKLGRGRFKLLIDKSKAKKSYVSTKETKLNAKCFICGGLYYARECPKREKLNAILVKYNEHEETITHIKPNICVELFGCIIGGFGG